MTPRGVVSTPDGAQALAERVALALTWAPHRDGPGGFKDGIEALDGLADLDEQLKAARQELDQVREDVGEWQTIYTTTRRERDDAIAALRLFSDYNEGEPCWCPSWWWDSETGGALTDEHSERCAKARAVIGALNEESRPEGRLS